MNLPNKISVARILLIPVFVFFYLADFVPYGKLIAALVFALACFTDFLDGYIARSRNLVTNLGKFLDSIADKVLVMAGLILLVAVPITAKAGVADPMPAIAPNYVGVVAAIIILANIQRTFSPPDSTLALFSASSPEKSILPKYPLK